VNHPTQNENITSLLLVDASSSDDFGIKSMEVYLNDNFIDKNVSDSIYWYSNVSAFEPGTYTVDIVAYDYSGNSSVEEIDVNIIPAIPVYGLSDPPPLFSWFPNSGDTKYQVNISPDPSFYYILVKSGTKEKPFKKIA